MNNRVLKAAVVQDAPLPLAIGPAVARAIQHVEDAIDVGAEMIAFGEAFLGGYPIWFDGAAGTAVWDHPGTQALYAILLEQALLRDDPRLEPLQELIDRAGVIVSIGGHTRVRRSLFGTQFLFRPERPPLLHRKLVPEAGERMLWGRGDGSTLDVHEAEWGNVGQLLAGEHWMPLVRATMQNRGESVHVGAWPCVDEAALLAARSYAYEGRCFVLAAGLIQSRADLIEGLERAGGNADALALANQMPDRQLIQGGSAMIGPDGTVLARSDGAADILRADLELAAIDRGLSLHDADGHSARPDIFELRIDRRPRQGIADAEDGFEKA